MGTALLSHLNGLIQTPSSLDEISTGWRYGRVSSAAKITASVPAGTAYGSSVTITPQTVAIPQTNSAIAIKLANPAFSENTVTSYPVYSRTISFTPAFLPLTPGMPIDEYINNTTHALAIIWSGQAITKTYTKKIEWYRDSSTKADYDDFDLTVTYSFSPTQIQVSGKLTNIRGRYYSSEESYNDKTHRAINMTINDVLSNIIYWYLP